MSIDWNMARAFLMTADTGSLSAAARSLGLTQPTLSRQVAALEADLGVVLFERSGKSLILTEAGEGLLAHVRAMGAAVDALTLAASARKQTMHGCVRISAVDAYCAYLLPAIVERIIETAPQISIELISTDSLSDLQRREADIAIRHVRPETDELIGRLAVESTAGFFASEKWVARYGKPTSPIDLPPGHLIGFGNLEQSAQYLCSIGFQVTAEQFRLSSDNSVVTWEFVKRGLGVGMMMHDIARRTDGVVEILSDLAPIKFPVWLIAHRELQSSRRIRLVYDLLADELGRLGAD